MDKHDIHHFLNRLTEEELVAILEAARIGLTQQRIAENLSLSEPDVNNLQHKIHMVLSESP
jgi:DNA-binding NarL/FixJ family response regulator